MNWKEKKIFFRCKNIEALDRLRDRKYKSERKEWEIESDHIISGVNHTQSPLSELS